MKKIILQTLAVLAFLAALPQARAWSYSDGDVLLIFRNGSKDVEFDIGSISSFLGKTNGYTTTVTNWSLNLVTNTFGSLAGNKVVLIASTGSTNWLSSAEPNTSAYNLGQSDFDSQYGVINAVGTSPLNPFPIAVPTNSANGYVIDIGGTLKSRSYDYVISGGQFNGIPKLGGNAQFTVEQTAPGFLDFWQILPTTVYPNPPPNTLLGTFTISGTGVLTFTAGPRAPTITTVARSGTISKVTFSTTVGNTYALSFTNKLSGAAKTWPVDVTTIIGNGGLNSISHTNAGGVEFYQVSAQ
ncbi:MAG TPA: hypothetical protein VG347_14470 [Verrucomicrobiae bacterium]|nr:hypothetical protein [Verrucomicrobiae bacterium]